MQETKDALVEDQLANEIETETINVEVGQLGNEFVKFKLPKMIEESFKKNPLSVFGTKKVTKLVFFINRYGIGNEEISLLTTMPGARQEGEDYETYRNRRKLAQVLLKNKPMIFRYSDEQIKNSWSKKKRRSLLGTK